MKKTRVLMAIVLLAALVGCEKMDDNYAPYLELEKIYSPRVTNLTAESRLREATLYWENPPGNIAKKIHIDYGDKQITLDELVETFILTELEIKGYNISVYTIDVYGNYSVPESIQIFPNGEE
jgi:hypothetical protein